MLLTDLPISLQNHLQDSSSRPIEGKEVYLVRFQDTRKVKIRYLVVSGVDSEGKLVMNNDTHQGGYHLSPEDFLDVSEISPSTLAAMANRLDPHGIGLQGW